MKRILIPAVFVFLSACASEDHEVPVSLLGDPGPPDNATQSIVIQPDTRSVNVTGGDVVRFISGGKEFAWDFNVAIGVHAFDLNRVAPPGILDHKVVAYVAPDPKYFWP